MMRRTSATTAIGKALRERGISIMAFARALGVSYQWAALLTHGCVGPRARAKWAPLVAQLLDVPVEELFEPVEMTEGDGASQA